ncbi:MAG: hypothetical protein SOZ58_09845 [Prevotella sp.]|nr:hypothetical protein [Prevotella sp.]
MPALEATWGKVSSPRRSAVYSGRTDHFNRLADHVRRHTDMERLYDILKRK